MDSDLDSVVHRYLEGDEAAFRVLLESQTPALRERIGRRMAPLLRRRVSINDVLQEVAIVAFERRARFAGQTRADFNRWIGAIADRSIQAQVHRHVGTYKRTLYNEVSRPDRGDTAGVVGSTASPSQHAIAAEVEERVLRAMERLPPDYREVIRLHRQEGASLQEVGERMDRQYGAVKKLHGRAMVAFIKIFESMHRGEDD